MVPTMTNWRCQNDQPDPARVGGNLPLSARAASASVPSDALTAATSRIDQRISRLNRITTFSY